MTDSPEDESSRVQRRLTNSQSQDRAFLKALRQKRSRSSQLSSRLSAERSRKWRMRSAVLSGAMALGLTGATWVSLFLSGSVTYRGVPYEVIRKFWQDDEARAAYFSGDNQALHDRLGMLGVEQDIKRYYRDQFDSEYELDRYIHQIMFDRTGYVGEAYRVDASGRLHLR